MKAITVVQPWATLIVSGFKTLETRSWKTDYRGPLAIHASKKRNSQLDQLCTFEPFKSCLDRAGYCSPKELPRGAIIGIVQLLGCYKAEDIDESVLSREGPFGDFRQGRYAWLLDCPTKRDVPIECRGALGIFEVPDEFIPRTYDEHLQAIASKL